MPNAHGLDRNRFLNSIATMSPEAPVPFVFALSDRIRSSSANISCSSALGVNAMPLSSRGRKSLYASAGSDFSRRTATSFSAFSSRSGAAAEPA